MSLAQAFQSKFRSRWLANLLSATSLLFSLAFSSVSARGEDELSQIFAKDFQPLLVKVCGDCHGKEPKDNDLDLTRFTSATSILAKPKVLGDVAERLRLGDMPPEEAPQPSAAGREQ